MVAALTVKWAVNASSAMQKSYFRYPAAIIEWLDAHARNQAVEYEESEIVQQHRPEPCKMLGLVIKDDEAGISLYNEETGPTSIRGLSFIPRAMVKSCVYIKLTKPREQRAKPGTADKPDGRVRTAKNHSDVQD